MHGIPFNNHCITKLVYEAHTGTTSLLIGHRATQAMLLVRILGTIVPGKTY